MCELFQYEKPNELDLRNSSHSKMLQTKVIS